MAADTPLNLNAARTHAESASDLITRVIDELQYGLQPGRQTQAITAALAQAQDHLIEVLRCTRPLARLRDSHGHTI